MRKRAAPPGKCPAGLVPAGRRDRRATSRAPAGARAIRRLCSRIRLVAEVDGRRLAHASGRQGLASRPPSGCADEVNERWHRPPIARSWVVASDAAPRKRAALAKARKTEHPSTEGALVMSTGRASAYRSAEIAVFDEAAMEAGLVFPRGGARFRPRLDAEGCDRERQRLRRRLGARSKTPPPGGAAWRGCRSQHSPGPCGTTAHVEMSGAPALETSSQRGCGKAEAGGSPSSEALPGSFAGGVHRPNAGGVDRRAARLDGKRAWESKDPWGARGVGRLQKSERRIFLVVRRGNLESSG